jgi:hypothetical protein
LSRRFLATAVLTLLALAAVPATAGARVLLVSKKNVSFPHFKKIQAAVNAAHAGDWVLIGPGVYAETVLITKPGLHLRGLNRNKVIVDGQHRKGVNGIEVLKANSVYIENLTVRNFDRATVDGPAGNEIWWNGGDGSGVIGMHGWYGSYLTAYDTGLTGGYGEFASNAITGSMDHVYASGFADSGLYVGACRDCKAVVDHAISENNALGYSGTNAGGHLVIQNSTFRNNSVGIAPSSLTNDDKPPPQDGACDSGSNTSPLPTFSSTAISHCTLFRNNSVVNNSNLNTPADSTTAGAPWGVGIEWPGLYGDQVSGNKVTGNPSFGIAAFEAPNPFPATADTIFFQLSGNRFEGNTVTGNGTHAGGADIGLEGGAFGTMQSVNNCFTGNHFGTSIPASIEGTWGCQNQTTPNGGVDTLATILALITESQARHSVAQPAPGPQPTMPHPCKGVPRNRLCG